MAIVRRANVILNIKDSEIDRYLDMGYDVIDESGEVLQQTLPTDIKTLQSMFIRQQTEIANLKAEITYLNNELQKANKKTVRKSK